LQNGIPEKQLEKFADDCPKRVSLPYTTNIGTDERITPNFAENFVIYFCDIGSGD